MEDFNKSKRVSLWWAFVIFLITIPIFHFVDNKQFTDGDLTTINNIVLAEDSKYDPGGGKGASPESIELKLTITKRGFHLTYEEYLCVDKNIILTNCKKGDTISIKIAKSDKSNFYKTDWFRTFTKLYGLSKNGKEYLSLQCRNQVSNKRTRAATIASSLCATLAGILALVFYKPKTKFQAFGQIPIHPLILIAIVYLICYLTLA